MATLRDLELQQGEGWKVTGQPAPKLDNDGAPIPNTYTVTLAGPNGAQRTATVYQATPPGPTKFPTLDQAQDFMNADVSSMGVEETIKAGESPAETARTNAATAQAQATTENIQKQIAQIAADEAERQANAAKGLGRITDKDAATLAQQAAQTGVSQQQLQLSREQMEQNGRNAAGQLAVAQEQLKIAQAQQGLADLRFGLEQQIAAKKITNDEALTQLAQGKFEFDKVQTAAENELKRLTQQQGNEIATGQLRVSQDTLQQRREEAAATAAQNAQTNAITAASTILSSERQAQTQGAQAGANLLGQRASAAGNVIQNVLGLAGQGGRYGGGGGTAGLSGGMMSAPAAGFGGLLTQGAANYSADLMGGQKTLDAAASLVQRAGGDTQSPASQAAIGVLSQMLDKYQQLNGGQPHPAAAQLSAGTTQPNVPAPAQVTNTAGLPQPGTFPAAATTPFRTSFTAPATTGDAVSSASGGFRAPQPMIVINTGSMQRGPLMG